MLRRAMGTIASASIAAVSLAGPSTAQVLRDPPTPFGPLVYEDSFPDPSAAGVSQGLKNIPLGDDQDWYVNLGGSLRERFESFSNSAFGFHGAGGAPSEDYILHRLLVSADIHLGSYTRIFVQLG